jgi:Bifunctional DNA primase/polymerase, N-terminal/AAA domain/Primase C terminal 1 (PriCT-1)
MSDLLYAALRYAELGYPVFPCASGLEPTPLTQHGFHDATTDAEQIERWWTEEPSANIAIAAAGLLVVDIDPSDDGSTNSWLQDDPEKLLDLAAAPIAVTPRGGRHYVFRKPPGKPWRCTTSKLAPHVDTRTDGGYFVVPPSVRPDGCYRWAPGSELDGPVEQLPEPPPWLAQALDALATGSPTSPRVAVGAGDANQIPSGQRNATLARLAGAMRRVGMSQSEIAVALNQVNEDRCAPALPPREVERIASSVARYEPDQVATALAEDHWSQLHTASATQLEFVGITSRELATGQFELRYLIDGLLVQGQPGVLAGPKKTLKTNISIDLAIALSQGGFFLHRFPVAKPTRVGVMSGESGAATIQETARRIAASRGFALEDCDNAIWCFDVPQLGNPLHTDALRKFIERHALEVLILDPTYLMMMKLGDDASNLFVVGALLKSLAELAQATGCTPILCHHLKKGIAEPYEPAELENIAWAGFQEFVRQWILLNRRVRYDPDRGGHHELWMSAGGSAGHSGLWGLNIDEGTRQDPEGRIWDVQVTSASQAFDERATSAEEASENKKQRQQHIRDKRQGAAILRALARCPQGETMRVIRELAGVGARSIQGVLESLVDDGVVMRCTVQKNNRDEPAYRLADAGGVGAP